MKITGLDYADQRYMSSAQGRFTSPDEITTGVGGAYEVGGFRPPGPRPLPYADLGNPQSLNKYAYALNNPLKYVDPDGHDAVWVVDKDTGKTTLVIPVNFSGAAATPDAVMNIVNRDNTLDAGGPVSIQVVATDKPMNGVLNQMDLSSGSDPKYGPAGEGTNTLGGNRAHINSDNRDPIGAAAHDILHFAGINDRYDEGKRDANGNRTSTPSSGFDKSNIMTDRSGTKLNQNQLGEANKNRSTKHCTVEDGKSKCR